MPLVGLVDPSNYERAHDRPGRMPRWLTLEDALMEAQNPNPKWAPWTYEMIRAVLGEFQERGDRISTTTLTAACIRSEIIKRRMDYIDTVDSLYTPLRGTMVHRTLERYGRLGAIAEHGFRVTVDGIPLSCSPDLLTTDTVFDYKVPIDISGVPSFGSPYRHQTEQLMVNAFVCRHAEKWWRWDESGKIDDVELPFDPREHPAKHAVIVYIGPKVPKVIEVERSVEFITAAGKKKKGKRPLIWDDKESLAFIRPRLHLVKQALDVFPKWPDPWVDVETEKEYTFEGVFGVAPQPQWLIDAYLENTGMDPRWMCPGWPLCKLPHCLARQYPNRLTWEQPGDEA
jgi:hypothetical protein